MLCDFSWEGMNRYLSIWDKEPRTGQKKRLHLSLAQLNK